MTERLSIIVFSGTVDKLYPVSILASGAVAMGMDVDIFLTFWGLNAFFKDNIKTNTRMSKDFEDMAPLVMQVMKEKNVPSWYDTLKRAKELGKVRIHACSMTLDLLDIKKESLDDIVDDIMGVGEFIETARDSKITLFI
ncbi:MAG: DsrE/DsrF/DrsH-like family protein [Nitrososphaerales archaeon]